MSVLITGGTGFIGSYLIKELLKEGKEVTVLDYMPDTSLLKDVEGKYKLIRGDISSLRDVMCVFLENKVTDVFHLASVLAEVCE
ncbi:NAD-dependent epimerase/dehydratase family protein, partial [Candidatus Aerophobetes bacterium]|nr:NAD-dependent epimerase/dehydratase family protein [Candidatus Aerophobetes bacterium]